MDRIETRCSRTATNWIASVRGDPLIAAIICTNLHRLPELGVARKLGPNAMQLRFMSARGTVIEAIVNERPSPDKAIELASASEFREFIHVVTQWDEVIAVISKAFRAGNNGGDRQGKQMWIAPGVLAVNLWREFS